MRREGGGGEVALFHAGGKPVGEEGGGMNTAMGDQAAIVQPVQNMMYET